MLELLLPIRPSRVRIGPEGVLASQLTLTDKCDGERPHCTRIGRVVGRSIGVVSRAAEQGLAASRPRCVREITKTEQLQWDGLTCQTLYLTDLRTRLLTE